MYPPHTTHRPVAKQKLQYKQIKNILQKMVNDMGKGWKNKLPDALQAYRTAYKTPIGMSPFQLIYGKSCLLPVELEHRAHQAIKNQNMDVRLASKNRQKQISKLEEWHEKAYHSARLYKERTKRWHDHRIQQKEFKEGDKVLLFNSQVTLFGKGKLHSKWEGPFIVVNSSTHSAITIQDNDGNTFKVNGQRLKVFLEPSHDINQEIDEINLVSFDEFIANL